MAALRKISPFASKLKYYKEIRPPTPSSLISEFSSMSLDDELVPLASVLDENPDRDSEGLKSIIYAHYYIFLRTRAVENIQKSINSLEKLLKGVDAKDPNHDTLMHDLVVMLLKKADRTLLHSDLDAAIQKGQELLNITKFMHPDRFPRWLDMLAMLSAKATADGYQQIRLMGDVAQEAVTGVEWLLELSAGEIDQLPDKAVYLRKLTEAIAYTPNYDERKGAFVGTILAFAEAQWNQSKSAADLQRYIAYRDKAALYALDNRSQTAERICGLAHDFLQSSRASGVEGLKRVIALLEQAIVLNLGEQSQRRYKCLETLYLVLSIKFFQAQGIEDAERAIRVIDRLNLSVAEKERYKLPKLQALLATTLQERFMLSMGTSSVDLSTLDRCISVGKGMVPHYQSHPGDPEAAFWLQKHASNLMLRFIHKDDIEDLNTGISLVESSLKAPYRQDKRRFAGLNILITSLVHRYKRTSDAGDLDKAILRSNEALQEPGLSSNDRLMVLHSVCSCLQERFAATADQDHIHELIKFTDELESKCPKSGHPQQNALLNTIATTYFQRYRRFGNQEHLDKAIALREQAINISDVSDPYRPYISRDIGVDLWERYKSDPKAHAKDRETALSHIKGASENNDVLAKAEVPHLLAGFTGMQWVESQSPEDLEMSISWAREAVKQCLKGNPAEAEYKKTLAHCLCVRFTQSSNFEDLAEAAALYKEVMDRSDLPAHRRIECAKMAVDTNLLCQSKEIAGIAEKAVHILQLLSPRSLKLHDQQHSLKEYSQWGTYFIGLLLEAGMGVGRCLELSELCRDIITGLRFESRTNITDLERDYPQLAKRFTEIRDALDSPLESIPINTQTAPGQLPTEVSQALIRRHQLSNEFDEVVNSIRGEKGFDRFLQPPHAEDLKMASTSPREAVVIINASYSCSAIIIQNKSIRYLRLLELRREDIIEKVSEMKSIRSNRDAGEKRLQSNQLSGILRWLWDALVKPILEELKFTEHPVDGNWPRVWWVPTGALTQLPIHAAGYHGAGENHRNESALDRVVSSYASSVKALLYTRRNQKNPTLSSTKILLASMLKTDGVADLPFADKEINEIEQLLPPDTVELVKLREPSKAQLMGTLPSCSVFHFAGHGTSNPQDPSDSCLLLKDWKVNPFTVKDIIGLDLHKQSPWLAYLSACSTAESQDDNLYDESIHLMSACQTAGFQNVIGSLWEVSDRYSMEAARDIYAALKDGLGSSGDVALTLHKAVRRLREITATHGRRRDAGVDGKNELSDESELQNEHDDNADDGEAVNGEGTGDIRATKAVKRRAHDSPSSEPLIWAAYIHVGL